MPIQYDKESDTLTITLGPERYETYELEVGDFAVVVDETDALVNITIANASRFIARALAAGVKVEGAPTVEPPKSGMVWYDADSSMISAFGYDETEGILEVAFHRTGVYRYYDVPLHVFEGLRDAESKGRYMRSYINKHVPLGEKAWPVAGAVNPEHPPQGRGVLGEAWGEPVEPYRTKQQKLRHFDVILCATL